MATPTGRCTEKLRIAPAVGIAHHHPEDGHDRLALVVPQRRSGGIVDPVAGAPPGSAWLSRPVPDGNLVGQTDPQAGLAGAFHYLPQGQGRVWWRIEQAGIQAQPSDRDHVQADGVEQGQCGEFAIHDGDQQAIRQPAVETQQDALAQTVVGR